MFRWQVSYLAKIVKYINDKEQIFSRWIKSELLCQYEFNNDFHSQLMQRVDDENLKDRVLCLILSQNS